MAGFHRGRRPDEDLDPSHRDTDLDEVLRCALCRHPVTRSRDRVSRGGGHRHVRMNPAGLVFTFGCFTRAPGVRVVGGPTSDHSWFAGYAWRIDLCVGCRAHLGWCFEGSDDTFHGLILDRLVED